MAKYKKKLAKLQKKHGKLQELCDEISGHLGNYVQDCNMQREEMEYMKDFIFFKGLDEEFQYFRKNAFKDTDDSLPFPRYVI